MNPLTITVNPDNAVPSGEAISSIDIIPLNDAQASHFPVKIRIAEINGIESIGNVSKIVYLCGLKRINNTITAQR